MCQEQHSIDSHTKSPVGDYRNAAVSTDCLRSFTFRQNILNHEMKQKPSFKMSLFNIHFLSNMTTVCQEAVVAF